MLAIAKSLLGTEKHLLQQDRDGPLTWSCNIPSDFLTLGPANGSTSIEPAFRIFKTQIPSTIPEEFRNVMKAISVSESKVPWHLVIPHEKYMDSLKNMFGILWDLFSKLQESSYLKTYMEINNFINRMYRTHIDVIRLDTYIGDENNASVLSTLKSFRPQKDGMAQKVCYSNCHTITGRMTVRTGPRILTLPANYRDIIRSDYENGFILELDFKSLEPRIALMLANKNPPYDVYNEISEKIFSKNLKRSDVKIAVLCALYGASIRKLDSILDSKFDARIVIKQIKEYFCYDDITASLKHDYNRDGFISNIFGRPIFCESDRTNILYSNFIQSTAADAAMLGFKKLLDTTEFKTEDIRPLFLVHDALILSSNFSNWITEGNNFIEVENMGKLYFEQVRVA